jgi:hypothetical protein
MEMQNNRKWSLAFQHSIADRTAKTCMKQIFQLERQNGKFQSGLWAAGHRVL